MKLEELQEQLDNELTMVDIWAPWCNPCKSLTPIIEKISEERSIRLIKVNADESKDLAENLNVKGIPTVIFFKNGREVDRVVGLKQIPIYNEIIENHLSN